MISHSLQPGVYDVYCYADNQLNTTKVVKFDVILIESIKGITVTDLGLTKANLPRSLQINITDPGTNSSLMIDFGDGSNVIVFGCSSCTNAFSEAIWGGTLNFTSTIVEHVYKTNGTFYVRVYGWNLVSDFEVITLLTVSCFDCGTPSLSIRNGHPTWRQPRHVYRHNDMVIEAVTDLTRQCKIDTVVRTWDIQQLDLTTGTDVSGKTILTDLQISDPKYIDDANSSEIRIPPFYPIDFGLYRFSHKVNVEFANGEAFNLVTDEYVYIKQGDIKVAIVAGDQTAIKKGHGHTLLLQPGKLSVDPDQGTDEVKVKT